MSLTGFKYHIDMGTLFIMLLTKFREKCERLRFWIEPGFMGYGYHFLHQRSTGHKWMGTGGESQERCLVRLGLADDITKREIETQTYGTIYFRHEHCGGSLET